MRFLKMIFFLSLFLFLLIRFSYAEKQKMFTDSSQTPLIKSIESKGKSSMGALFRSVAFPGWGQFYNKKYFKAGLVFGVETTFITLMAIEWRRMNDHKEIFDSLPLNHQDKSWEFEQYKFYRDRKNLYLWSTVATIFISMFDAYVDAHLYDFDKEMEKIGLGIYPDSDKNFNLKLTFNF